MDHQLASLNSSLETSWLNQIGIKQLQRAFGAFRQFPKMRNRTGFVRITHSRVHHKPFVEQILHNPTGDIP